MSESIILPALGRTAVIAGTLFVAGERDRLVRYTLLTAAALEGALWWSRRQADAPEPPPPAPKTVEELEAAQRALAYALLKDKWADPSAFNIYLVLSKRRLPVFLPDDFTDAKWAQGWMESTLKQAAAEVGVDPKDATFRESTTAFLSSVFGALKTVADQTCALSPDVCAAAKSGGR